MHSPLLPLPRPRHRRGIVLATLAILALCTVKPAHASSAEVNVKAWPLVYHSKDAEAGTEELEIAWPLIDLRTTPERDPWRLLHLFSRHTNPVTDETRTAVGFNLAGAVTGKQDRWRAWAFPMFWFGEAPASSHQVVAPVYWSFKNQGEVTKAAFPLVFSHSERDGEDKGYLFLVWKGHRTRKDHDGDMRERKYLNVFPVYWSSSAKRNGEPTHRNDCVLPLFLRRNWDDADSHWTNKGFTHSAFFLVWKSHRERTDANRGTNTVSDSFRVFPLVHASSRTTENTKEKTVRVNRKLSITPVFKRKLETFVDQDSDAPARKRLSGRLFPLLFWGERSGYKQPDKSHFVLFPVLWRLQKGTRSIDALVPIGAVINDDGFQATNIGGPVFTRIENEKKGYTRYDALFPLFKLQVGDRVTAGRVLPLFGYHEDKDARRSVTLLWPFAAETESVGPERGGIWTHVFGGVADAPVHTTARGTSGELRQHVFPFYFQRRDANTRRWTAFPIANSETRRTACGTRNATGLGPLGLLYSGHAEDRPAREQHQFLCRLVGWTKGERHNGWHLFPLASHRRSNGFLAHSQQTRDRRTRSLLTCLYRQEHTETVSAVDRQVDRTRSTQDIPFVLRRVATENPRKAQSSRALSVLDLPVVPPAYHYRRTEKGEVNWSLLDPLYSVHQTSKGERLAKSFGGFVQRSEKDACGFRTRTWLHRVYRSEENSRSTKWELMPLAFGERDIKGKRSFGLLGGLFSVTRSPEQTRVNLLFLPVYRRNRPAAPPPAPEQAVAQARKHLEHGLQYLGGRHPERALIELTLGEPAFGNNAALYEQLGDACSTARTRTPSRDLVEKTAAELEYFTSNYPEEFQVQIAGRLDWRRFWRERADAAYRRAQELGADSALLRRKLIRLHGQPATWRHTGSSDKTVASLEREYGDALKRFPDDISLNADYVSFLQGCRERRDDADTRLRELMSRWPDSAYLRAKLITRPRQSHRDATLTREDVDLLIEGAQIDVDRPAYVYCTTQPDDPPDYRVKCQEYVVRQLQTRVSGLTRKKKYSEALAKMELLADVTAIRPVNVATQHRRGWTHLAHWQVDQLRRIYRCLNRLEELLPTVQRLADAVTLEEEKNLWKLITWQLERDVSYLTAWSVRAIPESPGNSGGDSPATPHATTVRNRLYDTFVDVRHHVKKQDCREVLCSTRITAAEACQADLVLGFDEDVTVWVNDKQVFGPKRRRAAAADEFTVPVALRKGSNTVVLRLANKRLAWGFYARFTGQDGQPLLGLNPEPVPCPAPGQPEAATR